MKHSGQYFSIGRHSGEKVLERLVTKRMETEKKYHISSTHLLGLPTGELSMPISLTCYVILQAAQKVKTT